MAVAVFFVRLLFEIFHDLADHVRVFFKERRYEGLGRCRRTRLKFLEPSQNHLQRPGQCHGRRGLNLADNESQHLSLRLRKGIRRLILEIGRNILVEGILTVCTGERLRQRITFRVFDERLNILPQCPPRKLTHPRFEFIQIAARIDEPRPEARQIAEIGIIEKRRDAVEFGQ